jgi:ABC-type polysaccharide/polyol phosphate export permease
MITSTLAAYLIAVICARYRDVAQIVDNLLQIAFFVTPVIWAADLLRQDMRWLVDCNPFAVFLSLVRDPLLGIPPPLERWTLALALASVTVVVAVPAIGRYHKRIVYYL